MVCSLHPISHLIRRPEILSSANPTASRVMACISGEFSTLPMMCGISRMVSSFFQLRLRMNRVIRPC